MYEPRVSDTVSVADFPGATMMLDASGCTTACAPARRSRAPKVAVRTTVTWCGDAPRLCTTRRTSPACTAPVDGTMLHSATSARRVAAGVGAATPDTAHVSAVATTESASANLMR